MASESKLTNFILIPLLVGLGVLAVIQIRARRPRPAAVGQRDLGPTPVRTLTLVPEAGEVVVEAFGTLIAPRQAPLAAEVSGRIEWVHPDWSRGLLVSADEELLRIDSAMAKLALREAEALRAEAEAASAAARVAVRNAEAEVGPTRKQREFAQRELQRLRDLGDLASESLLDRSRSEDILAAQRLSQVENALEGAKAQLDLREASLQRTEVAVETAREQLSRHLVTAPFAGQLSERAPNVGTVLAAGAPLAVLVDRKDLELSVSVTEADVARIRVGQRARIELPSRQHESWLGEVRSMGVLADPMTRSTQVEIRVLPTTQISGQSKTGDDLRSSDDLEGSMNITDHGLIPGQFAQARIVVEEFQERLVLAREYLVWNQGEASAYVWRDGLAELVRLRLGAQTGDGFLVESGLKGGDRLITYPLDRLSHGQACRLLDDDPGADEAQQTPAAQAEGR